MTLKSDVLVLTVKLENSQGDFLRRLFNSCAWILD